jgi:hypothetical protein
VSFSGVVVVECDDRLDKLHFGTVEKTLDVDFPLAIMTRQSFGDLLREVDTVPDLAYYLGDRFRLLQEVFAANPRPFLNLDSDTEQQLISHYKLHDNSFVADEWNNDDIEDYSQLYHQRRHEERLARNLENETSLVVDQILDFVRALNSEEHSTLLHSWELASLSRRQRATALATRLQGALQGLNRRNEKRWFAFFNQATGCWLVFFFRFGATRDRFHDETETLTQQKLLVEMNDNDFEYSVFGYGFHKSEIETGTTFDHLCLTIADASKVTRGSAPDLEEARKFFGHNEKIGITEFPTC